MGVAAQPGCGLADNTCSTALGPARPARRATWTVLASLVCAAAPVALATEPGPDEEHEQKTATAPYVDYIVVTGTRILRRDFESASPIVTVMPELFESVGAPTTEAALNQLPQFVPHGGSTSNNPSTEGQAFLNLRGLGPTSTLVLLDGRRIIPSNGLGVVDVNLIPPVLIERVEIVSGGASAVYGSDAVAGVVNFRLHESFEGFESGGFYGRTDRGDGEQWDISLTAGTRFAAGRGTAYGFVGRSERALVTHDDRDFSRYALQYLGPGSGTLGPGSAFVASGSGIIEEGAALLPIAANANPFSEAAFQELFASYGFAPPYQGQFGFNDDGTLFTLGTGVPGSVANFRGEIDPVLSNDRFYGYNFAPGNALQLPLERTSGFGRLSFEANDSLRVYAQGLYSDSSVRQQLAPTPVNNVRMPRGNPYVPADLAFLLDSRPDPGADFFWSKRASELGPRVGRTEFDVYQLTVGLEGYLAGDWRHEFYAQYGENRQTRSQSGNALRSRIEELTYAPDGGLAACGGFDIFGLEPISAECARYIAVEASDEVKLRQFISEASIEGSLTELPAGQVRVAAGIMHKREYFSYTADPIASRILPDRPVVDIVGFNARDDVRGDDNNTDVYVEALLPLLADRPGAMLLEAGLSYRHSQYDQAGGADAWKAELLYRPVHALRLRGSFQNAIRAPGISQLYTPQLPEFLPLGPARDPCEAGSAARTGPDAAAVEALCVAQGVPVNLMPTFRQPVNVAQGFVGGNPDLEPEEAETWTLGMVWTPTGSDQRWGRLQAAIDWYRIELDGAIRVVDVTEMLANCFNPQVNPAFAPDQAWCAFLSRDPTSGELVDIYRIQRNLGFIETSGIDLQLDWSQSVGPGTLGVNALVSWLESFERNAGANAPTEDQAGTVRPGIGNSLPEWRALLNVSYTWKGISASARTRHIAAMDDGRVPEFKVPSRTYLDLFARYDFGPGLLDGLRLGLGIENLGDRAPPIFPSSTAANTEPQQYDVLGRRYFVTLNYRY
jgi:iron complex outermembrane recepter protein